MIVSRNIMWWVLQKHKVSIKYITLIKDINDNIVISVRTNDGYTNNFLINI
jgi:PIN domain nuclease of toxin-antitoxin system